MRQFTLVSPNGDAGVRLDPESIREFESQDSEFGGVQVTVTWDRTKFKQRDPDGERAVRLAWPVDSVLVIDQAGHLPSKIFEGEVTRQVTGRKTITLVALESEQIPPPGPLTVTVLADEEGLSVRVVADNAGEGEVELSFGDGNPPGTVTHPGDGKTAVRHRYAAAGTYTISAHDPFDPDRRASVEVVVA